MKRTICNFRNPCAPPTTCCRQGPVGLKGYMGVSGSMGLKGAQGEPGMAGEPGDTGPMGDTGPIGMTGDMGDIGLTGLDGEPGSPGIAGEKGSTGPMGDQGQMGDQGEMGSTGLTGPQGEQGSPGISCEKGETGPMGNPGQTGDQGNMGTVGLTGLKGEPGSPGIAGEKGAIGPMGDQGPQGDTGAPGEKGSMGEKGSCGCLTSETIFIDYAIIDTSLDIIIVDQTTPDSGIGVWAANFGGSSTFTPGTVETTSLATDQESNIIVTGNYTEAPVKIYDENRMVQMTINQIYGATNCFVIKYASTGSPMWFATIGNNSGSELDTPLIKGFGITTDLQNNIFVVGSYFSPTPAQSSMEVYGNGNTLIPTISTDGPYTLTYIVKFLSDGTASFATYMDGGLGISATYTVIGVGIETDFQNNFIIIGSYNSTTLYTYNPPSTNPVTVIVSAFQLTNLSLIAANNCMVVKYDINGMVFWVRGIGGSGNDAGTAIATDRHNHVIVTGTYTSNPLYIYGPDAYVSPITLTTDTAATFIVKFTRYGHAKWAARIGGSTTVNSSASIATDKYDNIIVIGIYNSGVLNIYNAFADVPSFILPNNVGVTTCFIAKYRGDGVVYWATYITNTTNSGNYAVTTDSANNISITGTYGPGTITIYNSQETSTCMPSNSSTCWMLSSPITSAFIVKYNYAGMVLWATTTGGNGAQIGTSIKTDLLDNIIVGGYYSTTMTPSPPQYQITFYNSDFSDPFGMMTIPPVITYDGPIESFIVKYTGYFQSLLLPPSPLPLKYITIVMNESTDTDTLITIPSNDLVDLTGKYISYLMMRKSGDLITLLWDGIQWNVISDQGVRKIYLFS
jgi:hypothetical protein